MIHCQPPKSILGWRPTWKSEQLGKLPGPVGRGERHRLHLLFAGVTERAAHGVAVGLLRGPRLAVHRPRLAAVAMLGAGPDAERAVAGAIDEGLAGDDQLPVGGHIDGHHGVDGLGARFFHADDMGIQVQFQVGWPRARRIIRSE